MLHFIATSFDVQSGIVPQSFLVHDLDAFKEYIIAIFQNSPQFDFTHVSSILNSGYTFFGRNVPEVTLCSFQGALARTQC